MSVGIVLLLICLLVSVGFAAYQFSEARRWRQAASEIRDRSDHQRGELEAAERRAIEQVAEAEKVREAADVQLKLLTQTQRQLEDRFQALASEALQKNSQLLLDRSRDQFQHVVEPVAQSLRRFEEQVQALEKSRVGAYESITAQVQALTQLQERVRQSTEQLKTALRSPVQRGRWGELQLRRVVELAGMLEYCDFAEQKTLFGETNQRPDLIVRLPNHCEVVVDAKVSLDAYLRAIETTDDAERSRYIAAHARQVKTHVRSLGEKAYWDRLAFSPEFVVAFLPLESLFSAALESDPSLLEYGVERRVLIATPITLITLLLTIAHGWRESKAAENLDKIRSTGEELYTRLLTMSTHFSKLGDAIQRTVATYNETLGSLERKVLASARKFKDLRPASTGDLDEIAEIDLDTRALDASKWPVFEAGERE
ncbi:MAG: DNA recombination protein RmuC [Acidobacteriaceae bacterium]|nr:DNA recombination protein RmuC [Acidobacteriaceae bacterium]